MPLDEDLAWARIRPSAVKSVIWVSSVTRPTTPLPSGTRVMMPVPP